MRQPKPRVPLLRARDGAGLANQIAHILKLGSAQTSLLQEEARAFAERYLRDPTPAATSRMAQAMLKS